MFTQICLTLVFDRIFCHGSGKMIALHEIAAREILPIVLISSGIVFRYSVSLLTIAAPRVLCLDRLCPLLII